MNPVVHTWLDSGEPFRDAGGTRWHPRVCADPEVRGFIHVRDDIGGVRQFVAVAPEYSDAVIIGTEYARTLRPRAFADTIRHVGGAKKQDGSWWLTFSVEGLD